ncbi:MAG: hypothetical protein JWR35_1399 [Marmoricola sp.]|nr:hypothetical protein [Marmoricola sp.]
MASISLGPDTPGHASSSAVGVGTLCGVTQQNLISRAATALWQKRNPGVPLTHPDREIPHLELGMASGLRYALIQAKLVIARKRQMEEQPWLTRDAIELLAGMLRPTDTGLEFGSGGSTVWLARHVGFVTSVEAFDQWYDPLIARLAEAKLNNVSLQLVSAEKLGYESEAHREAYINVSPELTAGSLDFVLVDGEYRDDTALRGIELLRSGGLMILDNANTYLPAPSNSPWKVSGPASKKWIQFLDEVSGWRHIWTTNGAWDTAIWVKP